MIQKKQDKEQAPLRTIIVPVRFTEDEHEQLCKIARDSGKSKSDVLRSAVSKIRLHSRLSDKEATALSSLTDARGDLVNVISALHDTPDAIKHKLFKSEKFMGKWISAIDKIVAQWDNIIENLLQ